MSQRTVYHSAALYSKVTHRTPDSKKFGGALYQCYEFRLCEAECHVVLGP